MITILVSFLISFVSPMQRAADLVPGLRAEAPWLDADAAFDQSFAAVTAETHDISAPELLALAYRESRYTNAATPGCGVVQVRGLSRRACARVRASALAGYRAGAAVFGRWAALCRKLRAKRVSHCAWQGYSEGTAAARRGYGVKCGKHRKRCDRGASIIARARRIAAPISSDYGS